MPDGKQVKSATRFVVLLGLVSLFADMTYEAARSISGPYLELLKVSGATVGWVAGLGELLGYGLRIISGYISDKTKKYWTITITGYLLNLLSVPLLAWAGYWQLAVALLILERIGKAIRTPARDAMLSYGAHQMGRGWAFGLHEAMDQTGATLGPLLVSAVLFFKAQSYQLAFLVLFIPAALAIMVLLFAKKTVSTSAGPGDQKHFDRNKRLSEAFLVVFVFRCFYCRRLCRFSHHRLSFQKSGDDE